MSELQEAHTRIQVHALKSHGPANLNRDDVGRPKEMTFGGALRLRLSSQAIKRAIRTSEFFSAFRQRAEQEYKATTMIRTTWLKKILEEKLQDISEEQASRRDEAIQEALDLFSPGKAKKKAKQKKTEGKTGRKTAKAESVAKLPEEEDTTQLLALSRHEIEWLANAIRDALNTNADDVNWDDALPDYVKQREERKLRGDLSPEMQLFGRMVTADKIFSNVNSPLQVAHAFTTHEVKVERDYWTGVDDWKQEHDIAGGGMIDVRRFGAGVFYQYACLDVDLLTKNIQEAFIVSADGAPFEAVKKESLVKELICAFLEAFAVTNPSGYQNSFASHSPAYSMAVEAGGAFPYSAASAFERAVRKDKQGGYQETSRQALREWNKNRHKIYGDYLGEWQSMALQDEDSLSLKMLVQWAIDKAQPAIAETLKRTS
ncbi:MAG: type I-E CRISPR-associated protein Cas7/Cse4/CasC [Gammaproteobacteria bacterium]|nr:type I-E CRISPR-associated protein Cas7/Cse4/CasC [Gammaproteobacteria bacterium]